MTKEPTPLKKLSSITRFVDRELPLLKKLLEQQETAHQKETESLEQRITALEQERNHFSLTLRQADQPLLAIRSDSTIQEVSNSFLHFTGYTREEVQGKPVAEYVRGLRLLHVPMDLTDIRVKISKKDGKKGELLADVCYFRIGEGDQTTYRAAIYFKTRPWLTRLAGIVHTKSKEVHINAKKCATDGHLKIITIEGKPTQPLISSIVQAYADYVHLDAPNGKKVLPATKGAVIDFQGIKSCESKIYEDLTTFNETMSAKGFTLAIVHANETIKGELLEAKFPKENIR